MKSRFHTVGLRYFVEVARSGSLSAASARLRVDIAAISRQVAKLEHDLGCALFERLPRGMKLSNRGRKLLGYATRTLLDEELLMRELQDDDDLEGGLIRIASTQSLS